MNEKEKNHRDENLYLMRQCIRDARNVLYDEKMIDMQSSILNVAVALFNKRALEVRK